MSSADISAALADQLYRVLEKAVDRKLLEAHESGGSIDQVSAQIDELGLELACLSIDAGGAGLGWSDIVPILEATGYHAAPFLIGERIVANRLLEEAGLEPGFENLLPCAETVRLDPATGLVGGECIAPRGASNILVEATSGGSSRLCVIDAGLAASSTIHSIGRDPLSRLRFTNARPLAVSATEIEPGLVEGAIAMVRAGQMAGAIARILALSVEYSDARVQFGRAIGKFQAVQHMLAELAGEAAAAKAAVQLAALALDNGRSWQAVAIAKIRTSQAAGKAAMLAHAIHGAIGVTEEHMLHHFTRRLWQWRDDAGTEHEWAERLGRHVIARGGDRLWPDLVELRGD